MARKEKFGKLVLLEETEASLLGTEYRAAKLGPTGLEKIVTLLRLRSEISQQGEAARSLMDQVKVAAQLQNPNILKVFGIGKVESSYYITYEFLEGRSLQQVLGRCREEGYPFAVDHALLIASKVCAALEYAHARKNDAGARLFHGLLTPQAVLVSYEGEVRLKGFGYWPSRMREAGLLSEGEQRYLAPEQAAGENGDLRSDIYGLGAILFETLTGQAPPPAIDPVVLVGSAKLQSPTGDDDSVPKPIADILKKALHPSPGSRYADVAEMRKAIDTLLFSGDFTPTTFNLAFFMHSLFREDLEAEAKAFKQEREASYAEFLGEEAPRPLPVPRAPPVTDPNTEPLDAKVLAAARQEMAPASPPLPDLPPPPDPFAGSVAVVAPDPVSVSHPPHGSSPGLSSKEAASSFTFHKASPPKSKTPMILGAAAVAVLAALGGGYYFMRGTPAPAPPASVAPAAPSTLSPDVVAAQQRVKELEEKLAALEAEKQAAETKAASDAKQKVEAQAQAKGQEVDQAAVQRAQEEARQLARLEEERRQREELRRVEEQKRAEEARLAEERRRAEEAAAQRVAAERAAAERATEERAAAERAAAPPAPAAPPPSTIPVITTPPEPAAAAVRPGTLVGLNDPGVIAPIVERAPPPIYPPLAQRQRIEGTVQVNALVDERGIVVDTQVVAGPGGRFGLAEAAAETVRKRRYRPATKDGVPVRVWIPVTVRFELPK